MGRQASNFLEQGHLGLGVRQNFGAPRPVGRAPRPTFLSTAGHQGHYFFIKFSVLHVGRESVCEFEAIIVFKVTWIFSKL